MQIGRGNSKYCLKWFYDEIIQNNIDRINDRIYIVSELMRMN